MYARKLTASLVLSLLIVFSFMTVVGSSQELADEQVLDVGLIAGNIGPMDPHQPARAQDTPVWDVVFDLPVTFEVPGDITSDVVPELFTSWEHDNYEVWTFQLREGVHFHKGYGEMTAEDVKFSFDRAADPERSGVAGGYPWLGYETTEIVDDYTVEVTLKEPMPDFLLYLAYMQNGSQILSKEAVTEKGDEIRGDLIGTGPWMWEEHRTEERVTVTKNPDYWRGEPYLETINFHYMPSLSGRTMAFIRGDLDAVKGPYDQAWAERITAQTETGVVDALGPGFSAVFGFNLRKEPLDDWKVRAAIAYAIDRDGMAQSVGEAFATPQYSVVPEIWIYGTEQDMPTFDQDLDRAKELLAAAGYPDGFEISTYCSSESEYYFRQFEIIQEQLGRVGIDLNLEMVDHTTFHTYQGEQDRNTLILYGNGGYHGEAHLRQFWHSESITTKEDGYLNMYHYGDVVGSIDDILADAAGKSPEVKGELFARAQRQIINDLAAYPTIHQKLPVGRHEYVDLGYEPISATTGSFYNLPWNTRILAH